MNELERRRLESERRRLMRQRADLTETIRAIEAQLRRGAKETSVSGRIAVATKT